jgi:hypothetical protein
MKTITVDHVLEIAIKAYLERQQERNPAGS